MNSLLLLLLTGFRVWLVVGPEPPATHNRLFFIQRSSNANVIVYDAHLRGAGQFDPDEPVAVYWLRYAEQGQRKPLTWIQRTFAYGLTDADPQPDRSLKTHLVSYRKRPLYLSFDPVGRPMARLLINQRMARLQRVFVQVNIDAQGRPKSGSVKYVDLFGTDLQTGTPIHERINP